MIGKLIHEGVEYRGVLDINEEQDIASGVLMFYDHDESSFNIVLNEKARLIVILDNMLNELYSEIEKI